MEVKSYTYEELPEFTDEVEGAGIIETTGDETGVNYFHDVEYANVAWDFMKHYSRDLETKAVIYDPYVD